MCSMCEVYQEEVRDLLAECNEEEGPQALAVRGGAQWRRCDHRRTQ